MSKVVGVDLSLTGTGIAVLSAHNGAGWPVDTVDVFTVGAKGRRSDTVAQRDERLTTLAGQVGDACEGAALVVLEGPSMMSKGGSNWDRAGLWWFVVGLLRRGLSVPVAVAAPTVVKKFATGKGNADKTAVAVAMARLWGDGMECANDNEYDALSLATMGTQRLGFDVPSRAHHAACLTSVEWPESLAVAA